MIVVLSENYWPSAELKQFLFLNVYDESPLYRLCHLMQMLQWELWHSHHMSVGEV
jgi:hypothetical protein